MFFQGVLGWSSTSFVLPRTLKCLYGWGRQFCSFCSQEADSCGFILKSWVYFKPHDPGEIVVSNCGSMKSGWTIQNIVLFMLDMISSVILCNDPFILLNSFALFSLHFSYPAQHFHLDYLASLYESPQNLHSFWLLFFVSNVVPCCQISIRILEFLFILVCILLAILFCLISDIYSFSYPN